jgi:hypothetical protein
MALGSGAYLVELFDVRHVDVPDVALFAHTVMFLGLASKELSRHLVRRIDWTWTGQTVRAKDQPQQLCFIY